MNNSCPAQRDAPLYRAVRGVQEGASLPLHIPLHGRGRGAPHLLRSGLGPAMRWDFSEIFPLDDLHAPRGAIQGAQRLAAKLFGARKSFFLVNGVTVGLLALFLAHTRPGDKVLLTRISHKAALHGLALSGAAPVYLPVERDPQTGLPLNVSPATVEKALQEHPDARMLLLTSPSYWGITADLPAIGKAVRERGLLFAVDEAHGAHLLFDGGKMPHAVAAGADAWIHSGHKSLGALTPGAYLHLGERAREAGLSFWLQALQTSSPSYPVMVSLDLARRQAALGGRRIFLRTRRWALSFRRALQEEGLSVYNPGSSGGQAFNLDPCRVTLLCRGGRGRLLGRLLSSRYGLMVELEEDDYLLMVLGPAVLSYHPGSLARQVARAALEAGQSNPAGRQGPASHSLFPFLHEAAANSGRPFQDRCQAAPFVLTPREALGAATRSCRLEEAAGRVCAEMIVLSPPGFPLLAPGELIKPRVVEYLLAKRRAGHLFHGARDPRLRAVKVVTGLH